MKGYIINKKEYVFPKQEADVIPYVPDDVEVIYIQHEEVDAYKELNEAYEDLIKGYNYYAITINKKEWAGHANDDIVSPTPEPQDPELAWSADAATVTIGADDNVFPTLSNPHDLAVSYNSSDEGAATIDENGDITLVEAGSTTISAVFDGNDEYLASTVSYALTVEAAPAPSEYTITFADDYSELIYDTEVVTAIEGTDLLYRAKEGVDLYNDYRCYVFDSNENELELTAPTAESNGVGFTMPASNVTVDITYWNNAHKSGDTLTITLVNDGSFTSDELADLFTDNQTWTAFTKDDVAVVDPSTTCTFDETDPQNPVLTSVTFKTSSDVIFTIALEDGEYVLQPNSDYQDLAGVYEFTFGAQL